MNPTHDSPAVPPGVRTMAIVRWILVGSMAIAATLAVLDYLGAFRRQATAEHVGRYQCPMHPEQISDKPGHCPVAGCNMELEKRSKK